MIEETVFLTNNEIIDFVKDIYGLEINNVKKINRGSANIYSLDNDKYILKEFQSKYNKSEIEKEIVIINHLQEKGLKVPVYIKTLDNSYSSKYKNRIIIIQKFIEGYLLNNNEGTYEQTIECADTYGKLIKGLENLPIKLPSIDISNWYSKDSFEISIRKHKDLLLLLKEDNEVDKKIKIDILEKINMIKEISKNIDLSEMKNLTIKNTHGDYSVQQLIYKDNHINAVIDFVSASELPIVWELIRSYSYIDKDAKDGKFNLDNFIEYIKTFNKYIKLNKYDLKYMPYLYLIQILNSDYGYKQYINNHKNIKSLEFAYFRTNIARYLYNNADLISEKLLEEL